MKNMGVARSTMMDPFFFLSFVVQSIRHGRCVLLSLMPTKWKVSWIQEVSPTVKSDIY
jgi:hypothetical protein